jgi:hypothetical protein
VAQARSIDTLARLILYAGESVSTDLLSEARAKLGVLLGM